MKIVFLGEIFSFIMYTLNWSNLNRQIYPYLSYLLICLIKFDILPVQSVHKETTHVFITVYKVFINLV